jgi:hypothetical protein
MTKNKTTIRKGAILPKDIVSLIGRQVYFRGDSTYLNSSKRLIPRKLYTIQNVDTGCFTAGDYQVLVHIIDDKGTTLHILLGNMTCSHLVNRYYWSLKQLPATISLKDYI